MVLMIQKIDERAQDYSVVFGLRLLCTFELEIEASCIYKKPVIQILVRLEGLFSILQKLKVLKEFLPLPAQKRLRLRREERFRCRWPPDRH